MLHHRRFERDTLACLWTPSPLCCAPPAIYAGRTWNALAGGPTRAAFPPGLFTSVFTPSGTFPECESFALEQFTEVETDAPPPKSYPEPGTPVADPSVPVDLDVQNTFTTMGGGELAGRGGA